MAFLVLVGNIRGSAKNVVTTSCTGFHIFLDWSSPSISCMRKMHFSKVLKPSKNISGSIVTRPAFNWLNKRKVNPFRLLPSNFMSRSFVSKSPLDANRQILHDVLVYSHTNDSFYKTLSYFGVFQLLLWGYLSFTIQDLKLPTIKDVNDPPLWKKCLYKEGQYKNALSTLSMIVGASIFFITFTYPRRAVKNLWMLKGGKDVKITTYSWMGKENTFTKPIEHINCLQSRTGAGQHVPLQLKGSSFYFLLDKKGSFHNTDLFDFLIAVKRNIK